jgi:imidazolonepropionase-like amidohydrolase
MRPIHAAAAAAITLALSGFTAPAHAQGTAYEGARVIVGDGRVIENGTIVVDGARITQVGAAADVKVPAGAKRVSLTGKTVMPMLIDTHVHLSGKRETMIRDLKQRAYWGVSTAMSMGTDNLELLPMRDEVIPGAARFLSAGRGITRPEPLRPTIFINSPEEGRKAIQDNAKLKVDIVKIWVDDRNGKYKKLTPELYGAVIDEAHKHGLRVTVHVYYLDDAKGLLKAGVDAFAHGVRDKDVDDEFMAMLKARPNFFLVPNLPDRGVASDVSWLADHVSPAELTKLQAGAAKERPAAQQAFGIQARSLARMSAAGVKIALGTDGGVPWSHHLEMEDMVATGMTPQQVIVAATSNAAEFLRLKDHGTIASGKSADFLVLDANPLDNITNTRKIADVYLRGNRLDRAAMRTR